MLGTTLSLSKGRTSTVGMLVLALYVMLYVGLGFSRALSGQQYTFEVVASGLKHQDPATRLRAIQILKDADYAEAAVPIAALLEDPDDRVQFAAIDAERSLFTTRAVPRRKKIGFIVEVRSVAGGDAAAAGQLGLKPRAVPPQLLKGLAVALRDNNPRVRAEAIGLAALLGRVACLPAPAQAACDDIGNALVDHINAREPLLRRAAMHALGQLRYVNGVQALSDRLSYHQRGLDAMAALEGLASIGHATSASVFEALLTSSNADMRRFAVEGLARVGNREVLPALQQMGQNERSNGVLLALHYAHVKLMPETGLKSCATGGTGVHAGGTLNQAGGTVSQPGGTVNQPGGIVDQPGGTGLQPCPAISSLQELVAALGNAAQRSLALNYLLDVAPSMAPALAGSLKHDSADVRRLVADVLGFSRDRQVVPMLEAATNDADPDVAAAAQQAIERLRL